VRRDDLICLGWGASSSRRSLAAPERTQHEDDGQFALRLWADDTFTHVKRGRFASRCARAHGVLPAGAPVLGSCYCGEALISFISMV
jgi:hypothetical protein